jgi:hypothetical protein
MIAEACREARRFPPDRPIRPGGAPDRDTRCVNQRAGAREKAACGVAPTPSVRTSSRINASGPVSVSCPTSNGAASSAPGRAKTRCPLGAYRPLLPPSTRRRNSPGFERQYPDTAQGIRHDGRPSPPAGCPAASRNHDRLDGHALADASRLPNPRRTTALLGGKQDGAVRSPASAVGIGGVAERDRAAARHRNFPELVVGEESDPPRRQGKRRGRTHLRCTWDRHCVELVQRTQIELSDALAFQHIRYACPVRRDGDRRLSESLAASTRRGPAAPPRAARSAAASSSGPARAPGLADRAIPRQPLRPQQRSRPEPKHRSTTRDGDGNVFRCSTVSSISIRASARSCSRRSASFSRHRCSSLTTPAGTSAGTARQSGSWSRTAASVS